MNSSAAVVPAKDKNLTESGPTARHEEHPITAAAATVVVCPECAGVGFELPAVAEEGWVCPTCHGSGVL